MKTLKISEVMKRGKDGGSDRMMEVDLLSYLDIKYLHPTTVNWGIINRWNMKVCELGPPGLLDLDDVSPVSQTASLVLKH